MLTGRTVSLRSKSVEVALAVTSGAYQTTLLTYFIQRDLFPAIMKVRRRSRRADRRADLAHLVCTRRRLGLQGDGAVYPRRAPGQLQQV